MAEDTSKQAKPRTSKNRRRLIIGGGVLVVLVIALAVLPSIFLRNYVEGFLAEYGMEARGLEEVSFNVFNLGLETGPLTIMRQGNDIVDLDGLTLFLQLAPLGQQRVDVTGARLDGLEVGIAQAEDGTISLKDLPDLSGGNENEEPLAWVFGLTGLELVNATINLDLKQVSGPVRINRLDIQNLKTWTPETPGSVDLDAEFAGASIEGSLGVRPVTEVLDVAYDLDIEDLPAAAFDLGMPIGGTLSLDIEGEVVAGEQVTLNLSGDIAIADGAYAQDEQSVDFDGLTIEIDALSARTEQGKLRDAVATGQLVNITARGEAGAQGVVLNVPGQTVRLGSVTLTLDSADIDSAEDLLAYAFAASLAVEEVRVESGDASLAQIDDIALAGVSAQKDGQISFSGLTLDGIKALQSEDGGINVGQLAIGPGGMDDKGALMLGDILVEGTQADLTLTEDGFAEFALLAGEDEGDGGSDGKGIDFSLTSLAMADSAEINITDQTLSEPITFELEVESLQVGAVDSAQPDAQTEVSTQVQLGERGRFSLDGWAKPLSDPGPDFNLSGALEGLSLPQISDYAADAVGVHIRAGRLNVTFDGSATDGQLDAQTDWLIRNIALDDLDEFEKARQEDAAQVPAKKAVDLLQDKDGNITLNIPISGALDDPSFDLSSAISKAINNAIQGAIVTTLKVLFPVVLLADISDDEGGLKLEPVSFGAGSTSADAAGTDYMNSIAGLMAERPKMSLLVCGVAARADLEALRLPAHEQALAAARQAVQALPPAVEGAAPTPEAQALQELEAHDPMAAPLTEEENTALESLADSRRSHVEAMLGETHNIDSERLFTCRSKVSVDKKGPPRVELGL